MSHRMSLYQIRALYCLAIQQRVPCVRFTALTYSLQLKAESRRTHGQVFWLRNVAYMQTSSKQQLTDFSMSNAV